MKPYVGHFVKKKKIQKKLSLEKVLSTPIQSYNPRDGWENSLQIKLKEGCMHYPKKKKKLN